MNCSHGLKAEAIFKITRMLANADGALNPGLNPDSRVSAFSKELEPLMALITELIKTIAELTSRLARYEGNKQHQPSAVLPVVPQPQVQQPLGTCSFPLPHALPQKRSDSEVNFSFASTLDLNFGKNQRDSYRAALKIFISA